MRVNRGGGRGGAKKKKKKKKKNGFHLFSGKGLFFWKKREGFWGGERGEVKKQR